MGDDPATLRARAQAIREAQPGYGTDQYRGDPLEAVGLDQRADELEGKAPPARYETIERLAALAPINDSWLSGKPYYCRECGLGYGEFLACEEPDCLLESHEDAQDRLRKAHAEGKGMPAPCG